MKAIIIILGGITAIVLMYMLIFQKKPINIDSDDVTKIEFYIAELGEEETYYMLEFSDKDRINEFVSKVNGIRARRVYESIKTGNYANVSISMVIYSSKGPYGYEQILIKGNGAIYMHEGGEGDLYKMSGKRGAKFYKYVKNLCISDENCKIKHDMLEPW